MSVYDVTAARYVDPRHVVLISDKDQLDFTCNHALMAVEILVAMRKGLFQQTEGGTFNLENFPQGSVPVPDHTKFISIKLLLALRYVTYCRRYGEEIDETTLNVFRSTGAGGSLNMNENCKCPQEIKTIIDPIVMGKWYRSVVFRNYAPSVAMEIVHSLLKYTTVQTVILESYSSLVPEQLKMGEVMQQDDTRPPYAFVFRRCRLPDTVFMGMWSEFKKFQGSIQRMTFIEMDLSRQVLMSFMDLSRDSRAMKTVEKLEFIKTPMPGATDADVENFIMAELTHLPFLQNLTCTSWPAPHQFQMASYAHNFLSELVLPGQDFRYDFRNVVFPPRLHYLNFTSGTFTAQSLLSFLAILALQCNHVSLVLADLVLSERDWLEVFGTLGSLAPPVTIQELYWSGNPIPREHLQTFCQFFLVGDSPMRFLALDRIFDASRMEDFGYIVQCIHAERFWGLSLNGDGNHSMGGSIPSVLQILEKLPELHFLMLNNHAMNASDRAAILSYLAQHPNIVEFSMDGTDLADEGELYKYYKRLFEIQSVDTLGRPDGDLTRLFQKTGRPTIPQQFQWFRSEMQNRYSLTSHLVRSYYLCRLNPTGAYVPGQLQFFAGKYPGPLFDIMQPDPYGLKSRRKLPAGEQRLLTLRKLETAAEVDTLRGIQESLWAPVVTTYTEEQNVSETVPMFIPAPADETEQVVTTVTTYEEPIIAPPAPVFIPSPPDDAQEVVTTVTRTTYEKALAPPPVPMFIPPPPDDEQEEVVTTTTTYEQPIIAPPVPMFIPAPPDDEQEEVVTTTTYEEPIIAPPVPMFIPAPPDDDDQTQVVTTTTTYEEPIIAPPVPMFIPAPPDDEQEEVVTTTTYEQPIIAPPVPMFIPAPPDEPPQEEVVVTTTTYEEPIIAPPAPAFTPPPPPEEEPEEPPQPLRTSKGFMPALSESDDEEPEAPVIDIMRLSGGLPQPPPVQVVVQVETSVTAPPELVIEPPVEREIPQETEIYIPPPPPPAPEPLPPVVVHVPEPPLPVPPMIAPQRMSQPPPPVAAPSPPPPEPENSGIRVSGGIRVPPVKVVYTQPGQILPPEPAPRKPNTRVRRFESAAGMLHLPAIRFTGKMPSLSTKKVLLANKETTEVLDHTSLGNQPQIVIRNPLVQPDIEDVTTFSKKTVRAAVPTIELAPQSDTHMTLDEFYAQEHFQVEPVNTMVREPRMTHPLAARQKIVHPEIHVLGVPTEW